MHNEVISSVPDSASRTYIKTKEEFSKSLLSAVRPGCFDANLNINLYGCILGELSALPNCIFPFSWFNVTFLRGKKKPLVCP